MLMNIRKQSRRSCSGHHKERPLRSFFFVCVWGPLRGLVSLVLRILRKRVFYAPHRQTHVRLRLTQTHKKESKPLGCPHQRQRSRIRFAPFWAEALQSQASGTSPVASSGSAGSATGHYPSNWDLFFTNQQKENAEMALVKLMELFNHSSVIITKRYLGLREEEIMEAHDLPTFSMDKTTLREPKTYYYV